MNLIRSINVLYLTESQAKEELAALAKELHHHDKLYFQKDAPEISDSAYDALVKRNMDIENRFPHLKRSDSRSHRVGATPVSRFKKVEHLSPMLSLDNAFNQEDLKEFLMKCQKLLKKNPEDISVFVEPKIDGLSC